MILLKFIAAAITMVLVMAIGLFLIVTTAMLAWHSTPKEPPKIVE